ncbi:TPA: hypothetical protein MIQ63_001350, partial [Klebsiella aerogenes]|nr:hypothetical protein [Klebsiella aerogenes]HBY1639807.1 hypothetical protein [Klebsiella aerogenes]
DSFSFEKRFFSTGLAYTTGASLDSGLLGFGVSDGTDDLSSLTNETGKVISSQEALAIIKRFPMATDK